MFENSPSLLHILQQAADYFEDFFPNTKRVMSVKDMYVTLLPRLVPDTRPTLSDEQKRYDFGLGPGGLPVVNLREFVAAGKDTKKIIDEARKIKDVALQNLFIARNILHVVIPIKIWNHDFCLLTADNIKAYNSMIALEIVIKGNRERIVEVMKRKPWVWCITTDVRLEHVVAIVPLDNKDYNNHVLYYEALKHELSLDGFEVNERCADLYSVMAQVYDPQPWVNNDCEFFSLPERFRKELKEE